MSDYFNEAGEPLMSHSQARVEADLDSQSEMERGYDDHNEGPDCPSEVYDSDQWAAIKRKEHGLKLALVIPPTGDPYYVEISDYKDLNKYAECHTGTVLNHNEIKGCHAWLDDEGLINGKEFNLRAGMVIGYPGVLAGHMVVSNSDDEGETIDITNEIIQSVIKKLDLFQSLDREEHDVMECQGWKDSKGNWCDFEFHSDSKFPHHVNGKAYWA